MSFLRDYNENGFLNSWKEDVKVTLDTNGLLSMNFDQLEEGYRKFKSWDANVH